MGIYILEGSADGLPHRGMFFFLLNWGSHRAPCPWSLGIPRIHDGRPFFLGASVPGCDEGRAMTQSLSAAPPCTQHGVSHQTTRHISYTELVLFCDLPPHFTFCAQHVSW